MLKTRAFFGALAAKKGEGCENGKGCENGEGCENREGCEKGVLVSW